MSTWDRLLRWEDSHRFVVDAVGAALFFLVVSPLSLVTGVGMVTSADAAFGWTLLLVDGSPAVTRLLELTGTRDRFRWTNSV